jgi:hypothetical protein
VSLNALYCISWWYIGGFICDLLANNILNQIKAKQPNDRMKKKGRGKIVSNTMVRGMKT